MAQTIEGEQVIHASWQRSEQQIIVYQEEFWDNNTKKLACPFVLRNVLAGVRVPSMILGVLLPADDASARTVW